MNDTIGVRERKSPNELGEAARLSRRGGRAARERERSRRRWWLAATRALAHLPPRPFHASKRKGDVEEAFVGSSSNATGRARPRVKGNVSASSSAVPLTARGRPRGTSERRKPSHLHTPRARARRRFEAFRALIASDEEVNCPDEVEVGGVSPQERRAAGRAGRADHRPIV